MSRKADRETDGKTDRRAERKADREGLSLAYRVGYQIKVLGMHMYGPAQLGDGEDPHRRLERQRASKVAAARQARQAR